MALVTVFTASMQQLILQLVGFIPKLIAALIIWMVGKMILSWGVNMLRRIDTRGIKALKNLLDPFAFIVSALGKVLLFFIILDFLGIGSSVVSAIVGAMSFAIAIALGLAFGKALEPDAKEIVDSVKEQLNR